MYEDDLLQFEAKGAARLPVSIDANGVVHDGARIWNASYGAGPAVILLHVRRHQKDYATLSATLDHFDTFSDAVGRMMQTQPNYLGRVVS